MGGSLDYAAWCVSRKRQIMLESMLDEVKMVGLRYVATVFSRLRHYTCV